MYPVSSGFEEWIHLFVQDSFGQKRETLLGAIVWAREASPTLGCSIEISRDIYVGLYDGIISILHSKACIIRPYSTEVIPDTRNVKYQPISHGSYSKA